MASNDIVNAKWVGPYDGELADGTVVISGETVVPVPAGEAKDSGYWEPTGGKPAKKDGDE